MSFRDRINKSKIAIDKFVELLDFYKIEYAFTGHEFLNCTDNFNMKLCKLNDDTSKLIRFFPDMIVLRKKGVLYEIKNSISVEKEAFDVYIKIKERGYSIILAIYKEDTNSFLFINLEDLKFKQLKYNGIPIIDNCFLAPRKLNKKDYYKWKLQHQNSSGTTFGYIDFNNTKYKIIKCIML